MAHADNARMGFVEGIAIESVLRGDRREATLVSVNVPLALGNRLYQQQVILLSVPEWDEVRDARSERDNAVAKLAEADEYRKAAEKERDALGAAMNEWAAKCSYCLGHGVVVSYELEERIPITDRYGGDVLVDVPRPTSAPCPVCGWVKAALRAPSQQEGEV